MSCLDLRPRYDETFMNRVLHLFWATLCAVALVACGGGGGNAGTSTFGSGSGGGTGTGGTGTGGTGTGGTPKAADLVLVLSGPAISSSGLDTVTAIATALDSNRNAVAGVPISIRVDSNAVATPNGTVSNTAGTVSAGIGIGSDSSNRTINITATSGSLTRTAALLVQSGTTAAGQATIALALDRNSISSATPARVTATLRDARGAIMAGQVVSFNVVRGLAVTNVATALTSNDNGTAVAFLAPASSTGAGADEVTATVSVGGSTLTATQGFTVQATNVAISSFTPAIASLGAYGQTSLTIGLTGASIGSPVQVTVSSACVTAGKAALSPAKFGATTAFVTLQYRDIGCGALQTSDVLQAVIDGSASSQTLSLPIASPAASSMAFISSTPEQIFVKGSGFTEASLVVFEVRDANGSPIPNVAVALKLLTLTGGVTMEGGTADLVRSSDAQGRVTLRVNSGTQPTPVRISATIVNTAISTVSSNLSVAVGLPSQLNFSMSQTTRNIEGGSIDGTTNGYQIIAADRSGNPVPLGTSINFVTEGGQIEAIKQTQLVGGIARTTANFVTSEPRPADGRVTVTAYALGEESFIDLNGNNVYDGPGSTDPLVPAGGEPFQDLGNIFKDRSFNGRYDGSVDEFVPLAINNSSACSSVTTPLLALDPSIPTVGKFAGEPNTCDSRWSGAGQVYVRRAVETVFSTSTARPLWGSLHRLDNATCRASTVTLQVGPEASQTATFVALGGDIFYGGRIGSFSIIVADANALRLNPMAAGTTIAASTSTAGMTARLGGGSPVANTTEATSALVSYQFTDPAITSGIVFVTFTSPSGTGTTVAVPVETVTPPGFSACTLP